MKVIQSKWLISNPIPRTLKQHSQNHGSWLSGFEEWLSKKLKMPIEIFTCIQKENLLHCPDIERCYQMGDALVVDPVTWKKLQIQFRKHRRRSGNGKPQRFFSASCRISDSIR